MPIPSCTTLAARAIGASVVVARVVGADDTAPSITTLAELPPASVFAAGPEVAHYWAARSGRAGSNYTGAYLLLGSDYVWWTLDGAGHDPGPEVAELDGLTGHVVALAGGNRTGAQVATATAAVIAAIDGWACTADNATLEIVGPQAVTTGEAWDDATTGAMVGFRANEGAGPPIEGPINAVICQHLPNPGLALPILAVDVLIGSTADNTDRWRLALWTAAGGTGSPTGETLLVDLGRLAASAVVANRWARLYVPPGTRVLANQAMWCSLKGNVNTTPVAGRLTGDALRGDWTGQALRMADAGAPSPISTDPSVAYPSTFTATTTPDSSFVCGVRLVVGGTVGDASHHSATDPATWGVHAAVGDLGSTIDFNSNLATVGLSPPFLGMRLVDLGFAVGAARGTQPRVGVFTGGDMSSPSEPDIDGATLLVDGGRLTGSSTTAWEYRDLADTPWPASTVTSWWTKNNDATGTNIAFAQSPNQLNASPADAPMDFPPAEASPSALYGPEYEVFPGDSAYNVTNPAVTFVSPFVAEPDDARPRNIPGAQLRYRIPGITVAS